MNEFMQVVLELKRLGKSFEMWKIRQYATPNYRIDGSGLVDLPEDGCCVTVDMKDGEQYLEYVFDHNGVCLQIALFPNF